MLTKYNRISSHCKEKIRENFQKFGSILTGAPLPDLIMPRSDPKKSDFKVCWTERAIFLLPIPLKRSILDAAKDRRDADVR